MEDLLQQPPAKKRREDPTIPHDPSNPPYKYSSYVVEDHGTEIFDIKFCPYFEHENYFAVASDKQITIYKCLKDDKTIEPIAVYQDDAHTEHYYAVSWILHKTTRHSVVLLVAGTDLGVIRIIDPFSMARSLPRRILNGHGGSVNEICVHPIFHSIFATASQDLTARIWHCLKQEPLAILFGHNEQVLSLDFHRSGKYLATASMDHTVYVWNLDACEELSTKIKKANKSIFDSTSPTEFYYPAASTREIHLTYVDCVKFVGNYIFSKATQNLISFWKFGDLRSTSPYGNDGNSDKIEKSTSILAEMEVPDCGKWFIRFGITLGTGLGDSWIACGNESKTVHMWNLRSRPFPVKSHYEITHKFFPKLIRKVGFNRTGRIMIVIGAGGVISRCDKQAKFEQSLYTLS
uniref:Uncharacterized protein n=1 Tax=Panagrolaimus davidi TaxID=227884 RepID=A0A914QK59_9BILA